MTTVLTKDDNRPVVDLVGETLEEFINSRRSFTAHEVTRATRTKTRQNVRHEVVKNLVHQAFHQGLFNDYGRVLANLAGVEPQPWVYHVPGADLSAYGLDTSVNVVDYDDSDHDLTIPPALNIPVLPALMPPVTSVGDGLPTGSVNAVV